MSIERTACEPRRPTCGSGTSRTSTANQTDTPRVAAGPPRSVFCEAERDVLVDELITASGLGRRERATGSSRERARVAATKAIATAIDRIMAVDRSVGRHLQRTIRTGTTCMYAPEDDRSVEWILD